MADPSPEELILSILAAMSQAQETNSSQAQAQAQISAQARVLQSAQNLAQAQQNSSENPYHQLMNAVEPERNDGGDYYSGSEEPSRGEEIEEDRNEMEEITPVEGRRKGRGKAKVQKKIKDRTNPPEVGPDGQPIREDDWTRTRKNNHKEVERKRRENINDGITALKELIPSSESDEKKNSANKGAILTSAADYIRLLKNSEITNIEKWTYEKLLNDKALLESRGEAREYKRMFEVVETENQNLKGENQMLKETIRMLGGEDELDDDDEEEQDMLHANKRYRAA